MKKTKATKTKTKIPEYTSPLIEQIYERISQETFDFVANRMQLALSISETMKAEN
jgi:hypothetical protein